MNRLSIRWRIALWNTAAFALILLGFGIAIYGLLRKTHFDQVDRALQARLVAASKGIKERTDVAAAPLSSLTGGQPAYLLSADGRVIEQAGGLPLADVGRIETLGQSPRYETDWLPDGRHVRSVTAPISYAGQAHSIVLLTDLHHVDEELWEVIRSLFITTPVVLVVAASLAYFLAYKALSPVEELRKQTDSITAHRLDLRLPMPNGSDELGKLAQTINAMIARLERSFSEIRRFTADTSHELRTPLSVIRSEAELGLAETSLRESGRRRFESIIEECSRLTELTNQLLALCREEAGFLQAGSVPLQLDVLVSESVKLFKAASTAKRLTLQVDLTADIHVVGDAARLRQVLCNLIDNAIKYTPAEGVINVTLSQQDGQARVSVADTGIGIAAEHLPLIFDRFYQAQPNGVQLTQGAGLGLSIVKAFVEAHGGRIEVTSEPHVGSTFCVYLPLAPNTPPVGKDASQPAGRSGRH